MVFTLVLMLSWAAKMYVDLGIFFFYYNNWGISFGVIGEGLLFLSAGAVIIERKLLAKKKEKKNTTVLWKKAIAIYEIGLTYSIAGVITHFGFMYEV